MSTDSIPSVPYWAAGIVEKDPAFVNRLREEQDPKKQQLLLWIGCSDSRVSESSITETRPGSIFTVRNIANQFHLKNDDSGESALDYAVNELGVRHIAVVGHTKCGGCAAAYRATCSSIPTPFQALPSDSPINRWLAPLTSAVAALDLPKDDDDAAVSQVIKENVKIQVNNLCEAPTVTFTWNQRSATPIDVFIHGWVYNIGSGKLEDLNITRGRHTQFD